MSTIKGKGIPTRKTQGAIGDIYVDSTTGKRYKCTNAYGVNGEFDYTWRAEKQEPAQNAKVEPAPVKQKAAPEKKVEEPVKEEVDEPAKAPVEVEAEVIAEPAKEEVKEEAPAEQPKTKKRTNYAAAYDKKSK